ncbi:MAG: DUF5702 domain-containing protein [Eubacteriales bacterium]|nr:DUF5702 domain-containing protein [Eubacteriales bacterium]
MLRNKLSERIAASSLLLVLIVPAFFTALIMGLESAKMRVSELDYLRAQKAAADYALTHYDRDLWANFRLWAGREVNDLETVRKILPKLEGLDLAVYSETEAFSEEDLRAQILKQMKERLPLQLMNQLRLRLERFGSHSSSIKAITDSALAESSEDSLEELEFWRAELLGDAGSPDEGGLDDLEDDLDELEDESESESQAERRAKKLLAKLFSELDEQKRYLLSNYSAEELNELPLDSLKGLALIGDMAQSYADFTAQVGLEKLQLIEYVLAYFPAAVTVQKTNEQTQDILRLDGLPHSQLKAKYPQNYAEMILTGLSDAKAKKRVEYYILALRLGAHYASLNGQPEKKQKYLTYGTLISGLISIVSLGNIVVPPEGIAQVIIFAKAGRGARKDLKQLLKGRAVAFWPQKDLQKFEIYYHDFLRFFFLAKSESKILEQLALQLKSLFPQATVGAYRIEASFKDYAKSQFIVDYLERKGSE